MGVSGWLRCWIRFDDVDLRDGIVALELDYHWVNHGVVFMVSPLVGAGHTLDGATPIGASLPWKGVPDNRGLHDGPPVRLGLSHWHPASGTQNLFLLFSSLRSALYVSDIRITVRQNCACYNACCTYSYVAWDTDEAPTVAPDDPFAVSLSSSRIGQEIAVTIAMENNPGLMTLPLRVHFPPALTLRAAYFDGIMAGEGLRWATSNPFALNGPIVTLHFALRPGAAPGEHSITVHFECADFFLEGVTLTETFEGR